MYLIQICPRSCSHQLNRNPNLHHINNERLVDPHTIAAGTVAVDTAAAGLKPREELREISERERKRFGLPTGEMAGIDSGRYLQLVHRVCCTSTAIHTDMTT